MKSSIWLLIGGIAALAGGLYAMFHPLSATLVAEQIAGWTFLFAGIMALIGAFTDMSWGNRIWIILLGLAFAFVGVELLANPLVGILTLTVAIAFSLLASGVFKTVVAMSPEIRRSAFFWPMLISGLLSLLLGLWVLSDFPMSAAIYLGVLLAVELIFDGLSLLSLYSLRKRVAG